MQDEFANNIVCAMLMHEGLGRTLETRRMCFKSVQLWWTQVGVCKKVWKSLKTPQAFLQLIFTKQQTKGLVLTKDQNCDKNHWIFSYSKTWRFSKLKWPSARKRKEVHLFLRSLTSAIIYVALKRYLLQFVQTVPQKRSTGQTIWSHNTTENRKCVFKRVYWTEKEKDW